MFSAILYRFVIVISVCFTGISVNAQQEAYLRFQTHNGKTMSLSLDTVTHTLTYSYGFAGKPELVITDHLNDTIPVFRYAWYMRGGGPANEGLDLNQFNFENKGYAYAIYYNYEAVGNTTTCGIRVTQLSSGKVTDIRGKSSTISGSISRFRFDNLIPTEEL